MDGSTKGIWVAGMEERSPGDGTLDSRDVHTKRIKRFHTVCLVTDLANDSRG